MNTTFRFFVFTADAAVASAAVSHGVQRIVIDLEVHGKAERQAGRNTVISHHTPEAVTILRPIVPPGALVVRVNPLWQGSADEIDDVVTRGADHIMLPMWTSAEEVRCFVGLLAKRAHPILLLETRAALGALPQVLALGGIDELHVGLTDLHLQFGMRFLFEVLADGHLESIAAQCRAAGVAFGFGGVGRVGRDALPPELVLAEHERLGSSGVILSRSFLAGGVSAFGEEVTKIRHVLSQVSRRSDADRAGDRHRAAERIREIANSTSGDY